MNKPKRNTATKTCMRCGISIPPGKTYLEVYENGQHIGDRCYGVCPERNKEPVGAVGAYKQRLLNRLGGLDYDDEINLLADFIVNAIRMRDHQKAFFKGQKAHIADAKRYEKLVDIYLLYITDDRNTDAEQQPPLFGDEQ